MKNYKIILLSAILLTTVISCGSSTESESDKDINCSHFKRKHTLDSRYNKAKQSFSNLDFDAAKTLLEDLIRESKLNDEQYNLCIVTADLGLVWLQKKEYSDALDMFKEAERINNSIIKSDSLKARNYENRGKYHQAKEEYQKSVDYYQKAVEIFAHCQEFELGSRTSHAMGISAFKMKAYDKATAYFTNAIKLNVELNDTKSKSANLFMLARILIEQKKYKEAIKFLNEAYAIDKNFSNIFSMGLDLKYLADCMKEIKNMETALNYYERAFDLFFVLYSDIYNKKSTKGNFIYDTTKEVGEFLLKYYKKARSYERIDYYKFKLGELKKLKFSYTKKALF